MDRRTLKAINIVVIVGAVILIASFFLRVADITIEGQDYFATGLNLARGEVEREYNTGVSGLDYYVNLRAYFPEFVGLIVFGFMTFPTILARKDPMPRYLAVLFGILGPACSFYGYHRFINKDVSYIIPEMDVSLSYGPWVTVLGSILIIVPSLVFIIIVSRESKRELEKELGIV